MAGMSRLCDLCTNKTVDHEMPRGPSPLCNGARQTLRRRKSQSTPARISARGLPMTPRHACRPTLRFSAPRHESCELPFPVGPLLTTGRTFETASQDTARHLLFAPSALFRFVNLYDILLVVFLFLVLNRCFCGIGGGRRIAEVGRSAHDSSL